MYKLGMILLLLAGCQGGTDPTYPVPVLDYDPSIMFEAEDVAKQVLLDLEGVDTFGVEIRWTEELCPYDYKTAPANTITAVVVGGACYHGLSYYGRGDDIAYVAVREPITSSALLHELYHLVLIEIHDDWGHDHKWWKTRYLDAKDAFIDAMANCPPPPERDPEGPNHGERVPPVPGSGGCLWGDPL